MYTAIYGYDSSYISVEDCTFDSFAKGVWLEHESTNNEINSCEFTDEDELFSGSWNQNSADIGVYFEYMSCSNLIDSCDFTSLSFAIAVEGSYYIDIFGDTSSYSTISSCGRGLYAIYQSISGQGDVGSTGRIRDYGVDLEVYLEGTSSDSTDFTYKNLGGTTDYDNGGDSTWTQET